MFSLMSTRAKFILISVVMVVLHVIAAGYLFAREAMNVVMENESRELMTQAYLYRMYVEKNLPDLLYSGEYVKSGRENQLKLINKALSGEAEIIAAIHPGKAMGYYDLELNAVAVYAPADRYGSFIGAPFPQDRAVWDFHSDGRQGNRGITPGEDHYTLVSGKTITYWYPVYVDGNVIGHVFTSMDSGYIKSMLYPVVLKGLWPAWLGLIEMIIIIYLLDRVYVKRLMKIKEGVASLRTDLNSRIPPVRGDLGLVAEVVNELAANLYQSRSLSEQMFDNLPVAVVAFNQAGKKLICNRAAASILNCHGNCGEQTCLEKQNNPDSPLYLLGRTLSKGEALEEQDFKYSITGGHKHLWIRTDIIRGAENELLSAMLIVLDVTERNHMEAQLRQAEKLSLVGELAAGMAHEIRNPLTTVKGLTQVMASRFHQDDEVLEYTAVMLREIDRINTIIKELLLLSKPSNPALSLVDLPAELAAVCDLLGGKAKLQHVRVEKDFESNLPLAVMDIDQMKQVFLNISSNAISAMPDGGVLSIKAGYRQEEGVFEIIFKDNGEGIPEKNLEKIFDPFYTTKAEGTGLGLAVSYQIVRNHGGTIYVTSKPGCGSTFKIILPPLNMDHTVKREQKNLLAV